MKLKSGDIVKLLERIPSIYRSYGWNTGYYQVTEIRPAIFAKPQYANDPRFLVYAFKKVRKDGTPYKTFNNAFTCSAVDSMIERGMIVIVRN